MSALEPARVPRCWRRAAGKTNLLLGQSGMGKSTLLNALVPEAAAPTREHSTALDMGKHTTTSTRLYHLPDPGGDLIDSPGFQAFGLQHLTREDIIRGFPEFAGPIESCATTAATGTSRAAAWSRRWRRAPSIPRAMRCINGYWKRTKRASSGIETGAGARRAPMRRAPRHLAPWRGADAPGSQRGCSP